jgi:SAM-dependent methyltransferase
MNEVYKNPKYYEIAFSYRDIAAEVDVLEQVIKQYSHIPVSTVLELGCGPAPHLAELARRKYQYIGLDLSPAMLEYAQNKADAINASASFELVDMTDFEFVGWWNNWDLTQPLGEIQKISRPITILRRV